MQKDMIKKVWLVALIAIMSLIILCVCVLAAVNCSETRYQGSITTYNEQQSDPVDIPRVESAPAWTSRDYDPGLTAVPNTVVLDEDDELRAVWIPYMSEYSLTAGKIDEMVVRCRELGANAIIFHVRPFGDALYDSMFFPWSGVITGQQGTAPADGFDPLAYIIDKAHENGMQLHAWVNPLRIQLAGGKYPEALSQDNPYTVWRGDDDPLNDHWVVDYDGGKFYNPGYEQVRTLIVNGMAELAANYRVDGVHWDDYFYPATDESFDDGKCYADYLAGGGTLSLRDWRTDNINRLVRESYEKVKAMNSNCVFGISPAGNIGNCLAAGADIYEWCAKPGYIDYICPQIYWTFDSTAAPFAERTREWKELTTCPDVAFYVGLALYKAGSNVDGGRWLKSDRIIADQIEYIRENGIEADGFMIFSYDYLTGDQAAAEVEHIRELLAQG